MDPMSRLSFIVMVSVAMWVVVVVDVVGSTSTTTMAFQPLVVSPPTNARTGRSGTELLGAFKIRDDSSTSRPTATSTSDSATTRRDWLTASATAATAAGLLTVGLAGPRPAQAVGPVKINLLNPTYTAKPCPKDRPIPGEKAMKGMRGLCVTVDVALEDSPDKPLELVGVYGFVTDRATGESVLANNPDLSTDAGQFAMVDLVNPKDKKLQFEFIAAIPSDVDTAQFEAGIPPLDFASLRIISFPGGQQYGAINPCEMNEFSDECEVWETENGPYQKGEYMVKSNPRTKGY